MRVTNQFSETVQLQGKTSMKGIMILILLFTILACSNRFTTNYRPVKAFSTEDFCKKEHIGQFKSLSSSEQLIIEDQPRVKDELTINLMLKNAAEKLTQQSLTVESCQQGFEQGKDLFNKIIHINQQRLINAKGFKPVKSIDHLAIQQRITDLWRADQSARLTLMSLANDEQVGANFWAHKLAMAHTIRVDIESTEYIESLLNSIGWIDQTRFGPVVSDHAWILIQHADDRVDLQETVLKRMEHLLKSGGIKPANYAYLWDRVAVNSGKKQRYGTQPIWVCEQDRLQLQPVENMAIINKLRAEMGMNSVEAGLAEMSDSVCNGQ